jgi:hypothetical protein
MPLPLGLASRLSLFVSLLVPPIQPASPAALRIVVLEGEGAVNIIQQKTAVAPIVEVRDRNDQPVAGAVVQFAVRNGRATFNGARTLSVTTNAAGRAVAAGLTPTGSGTLQIGATAAFQGQTAAATIVQSNVMTAAQAAAASGAGAGASGGTSGAATSAGAGAGGAGGGGLSATTIAIVGGAAAGGALVAKEVLDSPATIYEGDISGETLDTFNRVNTCTNTTRWTARLSLSLNIDGNDVSGDARARNATNVVIASTCPQPNIGFTNPWGFSGDRIEGTTSAFRFRGTDVGSGYSNSYDFLGAINGDTVTGTLTITTNTTVGNVTGTGVVPVTLAKTQ